MTANDSSKPAHQPNQGHEGPAAFQASNRRDFLSTLTVRLIQGGILIGGVRVAMQHAEAFQCLPSDGNIPCTRCDTTTNTCRLPDACGTKNTCGSGTGTGVDTCGSNTCGSDTGACKGTTAAHVCGSHTCTSTDTCTGSVEFQCSYTNLCDTDGCTTNTCSYSNRCQKSNTCGAPPAGQDLCANPSSGGNICSTKDNCNPLHDCGKVDTCSNIHNCPSSDTCGGSHNCPVSDSCAATHGCGYYNHCVPDNCAAGDMP
jgi:hypothetical protein